MGRNPANSFVEIDVEKLEFYIKKSGYKLSDIERILKYKRGWLSSILRKSQRMSINDIESIVTLLHIKKDSIIKNQSETKNQYAESITKYFSDRIEKEENTILFRIKKPDLFQDYQNYCRENQIIGETKTFFYRAVFSQGFQQVKTHGEEYFVGIKIKDNKKPDKEVLNKEQLIVEIKNLNSTCIKMLEELREIKLMWK